MFCRYELGTVQRKPLRVYGENPYLQCAHSTWSQLASWECQRVDCPSVPLLLSGLQYVRLNKGVVEVGSYALRKLLCQTCLPRKN
jgi:hypothetical protein